MNGIEAFREKLYLALEEGNLVEILEISRLLDDEIVCFMKSSVNGIRLKSEDTGAIAVGTLEERSGEDE